MLSVAAGMIRRNGTKPSIMINSSLTEIWNPLEERLGKDFFDALPTCPGVYKMYGQANLLIYVGKAKNLRRRLLTYRRVTSNFNSRKTKVLVQMVRRIDVEQHPTEEKALLRENELIRTRKPPLNHAKKAPEAYYYISAVPEGESLVFDLRVHRKEAEPENTFGAFKGRRRVRRALGALFRQLCIMEEQIASPAMLPYRLLKKFTPRHYHLRATHQVQQQVHHFLGGTSDQLLTLMVEYIQRQKLLEQHIGKLVLKDLEALKRFYQRDAHRNRLIMERLGLDSHLLSQDKLDDYLVKVTFMPPN